MKGNIYVTRLIPQAGLDLLKEAGNSLEVNPEDRVLRPEELLAAVKGRDGVLCLLTDMIDEAVFEAAGPQCKGFANCAVGFNNIDLAAATRRGIPVSNTPGVLTEATADHAWALLFSVARRIVESDAFMRSGKWQGWGPLQFLGADITGATLGIVGAGRIGSAMARRSGGFGMRIVYTDLNPNPQLEESLKARKVNLDELLKKSDFISLHVALTPDTIRMIDQREFSLMKKSAILINASRGPVVAEAALVEALRNGEIAGAGLDVYEKEPEMAPGLRDLNNVVICPHIASATVHTRTAMATMAAENLRAMLEGKRPPNCLNPQVYEVKKIKVT